MTLQRHSPSQSEDLRGSTSLLLHHLANCDLCQGLGTRYCSDVDSIVVLVRHDRLQPESEKMHR